MRGIGACIISERDSLNTSTCGSMHELNIDQVLCGRALRTWYMWMAQTALLATMVEVGPDHEVVGCGRCYEGVWEQNSSEIRRQIEGT